MRRLTATLVGGAVILGLAALLEPVRDVRAQDRPLEAGSAERGELLYRANCITCHGPDGSGVLGWPSIVDAGAASADFQLRTGRMPFAGEQGDQALPKPQAYAEQEIRDLVAFVATLGEGPAIPDPVIDPDLLPLGQALFTANCAPCHGAGGNGGAVGGGAIAWPLLESDALTVAEAMLSGPGQMPVFILPDEDRDAIVTYVDYLRDAPNPGGFAIGGIGPVPEGLVAWAVGMLGLVAIVYLIGREWTAKGDDGPATDGPEPDR